MNCFGHYRPFLCLVLVAICMPVRGQVQGVSKMLSTRHNLSVSGTGPVRASTEAQLCVFCHTPHVPKQYAAEQLWNHQLSAAEYTLYSSDYLTNLNYSAPNQPNARSKLCLSCHDGTIAVGAVYNNAGVQTIALQNDVTTMPAHTPANVGVSLADDHPVGYVYDNSRDPELIARAWPWNTPVRLDPDLSSGTLECITCHEPHDDANGHFLRVDNANAALCTFCHMKAGWSDAIHKTSIQHSTTPEGAATTVGEWACRNCHQSHNGKGIPYLLTGEEENTCFASGCHGSSNTGTNTKDIQSQYEKIYNHPTISVVGKHRDPDDASSLGIGARHAECQDCHNVHRGKKGLHVQGTNGVSNVLTGVEGVVPGPAAAWSQPSNFTAMKPVQQENQICFKCHSAYAFGQVPNGVTTIVSSSGANISDQAMEFNSANNSAHPVQVALNDQAGAMVPKPLTISQMTGEWNNVGGQTMYCSDCHGNDEGTSPGSPQGPHGSNSKYMLTGRGKYWPTNALGGLWSLDDIASNKNNWQNDLFCANCHTLTTGAMLSNNVHQESHHQGADVKCITCHTAIPHGSKRSRLIGYATDVSPYNYSGAGIYDRLVITGFQKASGPQSYQENNCSMQGVCHGTQTGLYEQ